MLAFSLALSLATALPAQDPEPGARAPLRVVFDKLSSIDATRNAVIATLDRDHDVFARIAAAFAARNPGYRLEWSPACQSVAAGEAPRVLFVQRGTGTATVGEATSPVEPGALVLLRPGQSVAFAPALDLLAFATPVPLPDDLPACIRPDHDPRIADQPGGCATEASAYRRIALTWAGKNGPYLYRGLNAHRVNVRDSFTHYHPTDGGFDELYLVQGALPGAQLLVSERLAAILDPTTLDAEGAHSLLRSIPVHTGDLVYLPRGVMHRGVGGVLAHVITVPGFVPEAEIAVDRELAAIRERFALTADELPAHVPGRSFVSARLVDGRVRIEVDGALFTEYRWRGENRPHFYPVLGAGGQALTRAFPQEERAGEERDHPHHQSLWFAHGSVAGVDFWHDPKAFQVQDEPTNLRSGPGTARFAVRTAWTAPSGEVLMRDVRRFTFHATAKERVLDVDICMIPAKRDGVRLGDTKEGTMALRVASSLRAEGPREPGTLTDSEGRSGTAVWGERARFIHATGKVDGADVGLAILEHRDNFRYPTWWQARTYGLLAANPFGEHDFDGTPPGSGDYVLEGGQTLRLRYRFLFYDGAPDLARVERHAADFAPK